MEKENVIGEDRASEYWLHKEEIVKPHELKKDIIQINDTVDEQR